MLGKKRFTAPHISNTKVTIPGTFASLFLFENTKADATLMDVAGAEGRVPETEPKAATPISEILDTFHSKPKAFRAGKQVAWVALASPTKATGAFSTGDPALKRKSERLPQTTRGEDSPGQDCIILSRSPGASGEDSPNRDRIIPFENPTSIKENFSGCERTNLTGGPTTKPANCKNSGAAAGSDLGGIGVPQKPVEKANPDGGRQGNESPRVGSERVGMQEKDTSVRPEKVEREMGPCGRAKERARWESKPANLRELVAQKVRKLFAGPLDLWSQLGEAQRWAFGGGAAGGVEMPHQTPRKSGPEDEFVAKLPEEKSGCGNARAHELERDSGMRSAGARVQETNAAEPGRENGEQADSEAEGRRTGEKRGFLTQQAGQAPNPTTEAVEETRGSTVAEAPVTGNASLSVEQLEVRRQDIEKAEKRGQLLEQRNRDLLFPVRSEGGEDPLAWQTREAPNGRAAREAPLLPLAEGQVSLDVSEPVGGFHLSISAFRRFWFDVLSQVIRALASAASRSQLSLTRLT